ncbi:S-adenosyl-L-methionine-dependent methyltransferase [Melanomma pulvis-pyrius CBS 109.77]|uniref:S-adenosyl-L-methionine-dependent methyltransferase n=1 Tax=Melanomma pulvis-pyrius CBS 109.77 TaxID=1314802 RepID=A0A6A6X228_9PLEO|nr:S-adenosyl-L-methionine-dependent methyltransferase [Melanomma pulvis-pyrius CBS 109.77]
MSQPPRIYQLAENIKESVDKLLQILATQGIPAPSFDDNGPFQIPRKASAIQDTLLDATSELHELLLEPLNLVYKQGGHNNSVCLKAISRYNIASMVPEGGAISYSEIAAKTSLTEQMVKRLLRSAIAMRIFQEPEPNMIAHTKASKVLANPLANDWLRAGTEEMWPANVNGFSLANNTSESIYGVIGSDPVRAVRFANSMKLFATRPEYDPSFIVNGFDWDSLGSGLVVDVGGARGHIAVQLAKQFPNLKIRVQDMDKVVENADADIPEQLRDRVTFMAHDLFAPQTIHADVIYFRWIMHNWPDKQCIAILRAQIPALKTGVRIVIQDVCFAEPGTIPLWREKFQRMEDLNMAAAFNAKERTVGDVVEPVGSALGILEVSWNDPA